MSKPNVSISRCSAFTQIGINGLIDLASTSIARAGRSSSSCSTTATSTRSPGSSGCWHAKMGTTQDLPPFDFAPYARQLGVEGIRVESPGEVGPAWDRALSNTDRPVLIDVVTDPEVPPLPPHIRMEHAQGFARALLHGDADSARIVRQSLREKVKDLVTR